MSADGFYLDGGYADQPETIDDLSSSELDDYAQQIYGVDSWDEVEQLWQQQDDEQAAAAEQRELERLSQQYADSRLGQLTRGIVEEGGRGVDEIHLPALHDVASQLLESRDWLVKNGMPLDVPQREFPLWLEYQGEGLITRALRDAVTALSPAKNESEALERYLLRKGG